MQGHVDTTDYTTEQEARQDKPYLGDHTCMPRPCPKCGAKETWLSDPSYVGGRGYLRSWRCEHCSHTEQAEYSQYREMFWAFSVPHAGQLAAALAYANGATVEEAMAIGKAKDEESKRVAVIFERKLAELGISVEVAA